METVQQESLLAVVKGRIVPQNGEHPGVEAAVGVVSLQVDVVAKAVGAPEIVLRAGIVDGRVSVAIDVHPGLPLYPAGIVAIHARCQGQAHELALSFDIVYDCVGAALLHGVLLTVGRVEISDIFEQVHVASRYHIEEGLVLLAAVFHGNPAVLSERHLPVAVQASPGGHQNLGGIQDGVSALPVFKVLIVGAAKESRYGRFHRRGFIPLPVDPQDEAVAYISSKPDILNHSRPIGVHQGNGLAGVDIDAGAELGTVPAPGASASCPCGVFGGKCKGFDVLDQMNAFHVCPPPKFFLITPVPVAAFDMPGNTARRIDYFRSYFSTSITASPSAKKEIPSADCSV